MSELRVKSDWIKSRNDKPFFPGRCTFSTYTNHLFIMKRHCFPTLLALFYLFVTAPATVKAQSAGGTKPDPAPGESHLAVLATATGSGRTDYIITTLNDGPTPNPPVHLR